MFECYIYIEKVLDSISHGLPSCKLQQFLLMKNFFISGIVLNPTFLTCLKY